jgi:hypothetical protein
VLPPRQSPLFRRQQLFGEDHPRESPPVRDHLAVGVVAKVVAILGSKLIRPAGCQFVQPVMVCLNQTIVIEIVKGEAPDGLANRVEFPVDVVVGAPEM